MRTLAAVMVLVVASLAVSSANAAAQVLQCDFNSDTTWCNKMLVPYVFGGTGAEVKNGRVELTLPPNSADVNIPFSNQPGFMASFLANAKYGWALRGDFDVQVDYQTLEWPNRGPFGPVWDVGPSVPSRR
jgi:hypothetical protein